MRGIVLQTQQNETGKARAERAERSLMCRKVVEYFDAYPKRYDYAVHEVIAGAVDENDQDAFSFWVDKARSPALDV